VGVGALIKGRRAVFLDRDGVLNRAFVRDGKPRPPSNLEELSVLPGVPEMLAALKEAGFLLIVATNQPDVARGTQTRAVVEAINDALRAALPLDEIYVCYHDDADNCDCRKPRPGLLLRAAARYNINLSSSFLIGDRWKDVEAGRRAGCATVLIEHGYAEENSKSATDYHARSPMEAGAWILDRALSGRGEE
jgi:D-glycero-D-manno-heptose 1,7-bisphosphate phosphatase